MGYTRKLKRILSGIFGFHCHRMVLILSLIIIILDTTHAAPTEQSNPGLSKSPTKTVEGPSYNDSESNSANIAEPPLIGNPDKVKDINILESSHDEKNEDNVTCKNKLEPEKIKMSVLALARRIIRTTRMNRQSTTLMPGSKPRKDTLQNSNDTQDILHRKLQGNGHKGTNTAEQRKDPIYIKIQKRGQVSTDLETNTISSSPGNNISSPITSQNVSVNIVTTVSSRMSTDENTNNGEDTTGSGVDSRNSTDLDNYNVLPPVDPVHNQNSSSGPNGPISSSATRVATTQTTYGTTENELLTATHSSPSLSSSSSSPSSSSSSSSLSTSSTSNVSSLLPHFTTSLISRSLSQSASPSLQHPNMSTVEAFFNRTVSNNTSTTHVTTQSTKTDSHVDINSNTTTDSPSTTDEIGKMTDKPEYVSSTLSSSISSSSSSPPPSISPLSPSVLTAIPSSPSSHTRPHNHQSNSTIGPTTHTMTPAHSNTTIFYNTTLPHPNTIDPDIHDHSTQTSTIERISTPYINHEVTTTTNPSQHVPDNESKPTAEMSGTEVESTTHPTMHQKPTSFVELNLGMSWSDFCPMEMMFRGEVAQIFHSGANQAGITADQIRLINSQDGQCVELSVIDTDKIKVQLYLLNKTHHYDRNLTRDLAYLLKSDFEAADTSIMSKLIDVQFRDSKPKPPGPEMGHVTEQDDQEGFFNDPGISVAMSIAILGVFCCASLIVIQYLWRKRHRDGANLSTKHTNSSSSSSRIVYTTKTNRSFSLNSSDSIQLYSVSGKSSRRSSGFINLGLNLSDPLDPTHQLNVDQLAEFCLNTSRIHREYEKIPNRLPRLSVVPVGEEDKNRYANILPFPHTRVKLLQDGVQSHNSSYINASYVTGPNNECQYYIATQAPTDKTTGDFWTMVWQQNTKTIVMMTQMEENGQSKSAAYWPELTGKGAAQRHGDFLVELKQKDVNQEYIVSKLELNNLRKIENRTIYHYWYTCWPSQGTPEPISLVKFVLDCRPKYESGRSPLVVHCSPGTGRTCTFIGLDLCMRQFESNRKVDLLKTVYDMRHERAGAIQNKEQYILLYKAINDYAKIVVSPAVSAASSATTLHALLPG